MYYIAILYMVGFDPFAFEIIRQCVLLTRAINSARVANGSNPKIHLARGAETRGDIGIYPPNISEFFAV